MPRSYKANLGETRQGKRDIKHLLQKKKKYNLLQAERITGSFRYSYM